MKTYSSANKQQGTALVVSLLLLIVMTLIALSGSRNSSLQLRMASNLQSRVEAQQWAQAGLDYAVTLTSSQTAGYKLLCSTGNLEDICVNPPPLLAPKKEIPLPSTFDYTTGEPSSVYLVEGDAGLSGGGCGRAMAISVNTFDCVFYEAYSTYDNTKNGQGRSTLGTGMVRIVPAS